MRLRWRQQGYALGIMALRVVPTTSWAQAPAPVTAFVDVTVIPMDRERLLPHQTVVVRDGRIAALGAAREVQVPAGAVQVDGRGQYLIPGLSDMHTHLAYGGEKNVERWLLLLLDAGITTVRNVDYGGPGDGMYDGRPILDNAGMLGLKARAAAGEIWSPRIYTSGKWHTDSTKSIPENVAAYQAAGFDFVKIHGGGDRWTTESDSVILDSLAVAAHRYGVPLVGHACCDGYYHGDHFARVVALGQMSVEHMEAWFVGGAPLQQYWSTDSARLPGLVALAKRASVWSCACPNPGQLWASEPGAVERRYRKAETAVLEQRPLRISELPDIWHQVAEEKEERWIYGVVVKAIYEGGAGLLAGSDLPLFDAILPGMSMFREMQGFVANGLTPYQTLVVGTRNVAAYLGLLDSAGTITQGKRADLVLLKKNPLEDIRYLDEIEGVMVGGRWMTRRAIERRLDADYASNQYASDQKHP